MVSAHYDCPVFNLSFHSYHSYLSVIFAAEGISGPLNRNLNDHSTELLKLKAQYALALNDKVCTSSDNIICTRRRHITRFFYNQQLVVTGVDGGKVANALLQANEVLKDSLIVDRDQRPRSAILAELAVASGAGDVRILIGNDTR